MNQNLFLYDLYNFGQRIPVNVSHWALRENMLPEQDYIQSNYDIIICLVIVGSQKRPIWNVTGGFSKPDSKPVNNILPHYILRCAVLVSRFAICSCFFEDKTPTDHKSEGNRAFVFRAGSEVEGIGAEVSATASSSKQTSRQVMRQVLPEEEELICPSSGFSGE